MPIKLFQDGAILDANDVNTYFMDQSLVVFASTAERDAAFGGFTGTAPNIVLTEPALGAENKGRICYVKDDDKIYIWSGTTWNPQLALIETDAVTEGKILNGAVTAAKLASAVAGSGLSGGAGTALAVNVDGSTIEINSDTLRVGNPAAGTISTGASGFGYMGLPQNATTTGSYTVVAADAGKHIYSSATRTVTIPANATTAMPIGSTLVFIAGSGATVTIAITSDTMYLAGPGTTGSRTLAAFGMATAVKITATSWIISGNGLT
jgi:hypothetical protein